MECGADVFLTFHGYCSAMRVHDIFNDLGAEARSPWFGADSARCEQAVPGAGRHAAAGIGDGNEEVVAHPVPRFGYASDSRQYGNRVVHQIIKSIVKTAL